MEKKKLTKEELSRIRSEAGKRGAASLLKSKNFKGGRPKGSTKDPALKAIPARTLTVREPDYKVYVKLAGVKGCPIVEFMHIVADSLKAKNPRIFSPSAEPKI